MIYLSKTHDSQKNAELLAQITGKKLDMEQSIQETEQLFQQCLEKEIPPSPNNPQPAAPPIMQILEEWLFRPISKPYSVLEPTQVMVDAKGNVYPDWKVHLDQEYSSLLDNITREVNLGDFGAVGDGKTDCTAAFKKVIGSGRVKVNIPQGVFVTKGIRLPSWTCLIGAGKGATTIKLHPKTSKGARLVTNSSHWKGNHHILVQGLSLDWNVERLGSTAKTATWGNYSSCLTYANVTYGWVKDVEAINPGLHGFDISSTLYSYAGDGYHARSGSKYIWLDNVTSYGFGDDGITTHHSDYILISDSHCCDPSGRAHQEGFSNSNGIEVDDGSRNVVLVNNSTTRCFGGVEIKAHQNSSAASNVKIFGHISVNDNRAYNFRHIGHHKSTDPESKSAYNIMAVNLAAIAPIFTDLYKDSKPRGLVVSAYKNVVINQFTVIGDPDYDFKGNPIATIQYRARKVVLKDILLKNFKNAGPGIKVFGGDNRADSVTVSSVEADHTISKPIDIGKGLQDIKVDKVTERTPAILINGKRI